MALRDGWYDGRKVGQQAGCQQRGDLGVGQARQDTIRLFAAHVFGDCPCFPDQARVGQTKRIPLQGAHNGDPVAGLRRHRELNQFAKDMNGTVPRAVIRFIVDHEKAGVSRNFPGIVDTRSKQHEVNLVTTFDQPLGDAQKRPFGASPAEIGQDKGHVHTGIATQDPFLAKRGKLTPRHIRQRPHGAAFSSVDYVVDHGALECQVEVEHPPRRCPRPWSCSSLQGPKSQFAEDGAALVLIEIDADISERLAEGPGDLLHSFPCLRSRRWLGVEDILVVEMEWKGFVVSSTIVSRGLPAARSAII